MKPLVNFERKQVSILHAQRRYFLPTCVMGHDGRCVSGVIARGSADVETKSYEVSQCSMGPSGVLRCDFSSRS